MLARDLVLPGDDLLHPLGLDQAERGGELAHAEVEAVDLVVGLAVVAERRGELEQRPSMAGDEHAALAGRDGLGRVERVDAGVAEGARARAVPVGAVGVGAVLEQEDAVLAAEGGDPLGVEGDVAADVDEDGRARLVLVRLALEVLERHAEVVAVAVDELDLAPAFDRRQRRRHEGVGGAQHGLAAHAGELQRRQRRRRSSPTARPSRRPFQAAHAASKRRVSSPSDHWLESMTSSQSSCRRARSRWSNPILNDENGARGAVPVS